MINKSAIISILTLVICLGLISTPVLSIDDDDTFTTDFRLQDCKFVPWGVNPYFILIPGYQLVLEGEEDDEEILLQITVLDKIKYIDLRNEGLGIVKTRVVEEREWVDEEIAEISWNYFARCCKTNSIYYFGEDVDIYEDGEVVGHEGAWIAGQKGTMPGLIMPGTFLLNSKYYQEIAPKVAMDRAENVSMGLKIKTDAGNFKGCVEVRETTPLEPDSESIKKYCPGVGLVYDDGIELVDYGMIFWNNH